MLDKILDFGGDGFLWLEQFGQRYLIAALVILWSLMVCRLFRNGRITDRRIAR